MTTVTIELPDELVENLDLKQLSNEFVDFVLSKNKPSFQQLADDADKNLDDNKKQFLERVKNIKRVTAPYSSEILVSELRNEKTISPITQSLIGLLANSNLDEADYKKHLEDKYL